VLFSGNLGLHHYKFVPCHILQDLTTSTTADAADTTTTTHPLTYFLLGLLSSLRALANPNNCKVFTLFFYFFIFIFAPRVIEFTRYDENHDLTSACLFVFLFFVCLFV